MKKVNLKKTSIGYDVYFEKKFIGKIKKWRNTTKWQWEDFNGKRLQFVYNKRNETLRPLLHFIVYNYPNYIPLKKEDFFIDAMNRGLGIEGDLY